MSSSKTVSGFNGLFRVKNDDDGRSVCVMHIKFDVCYSSR